VPIHKEPSSIIPGVPAITQHEILNNRRHVLTKDTAGSVKLWEITRGAVIEDFGKVSFEDKKKELFEMHTCLVYHGCSIGMPVCPPGYTSMLFCRNICS
ncbi:Os12g0165000, partial [Oryza sativa Japonica Group]